MATRQQNLNTPKTPGPAIESDVAVALDYAMEHGMMAYPLEFGDIVLVFTPTFIWWGAVSRFGPLGFELAYGGQRIHKWPEGAPQARIVYDAGNREGQASGKFNESDGVMGTPNTFTMWTSTCTIHRWDPDKPGHREMFAEAISRSEEELKAWHARVAK